MHQRALEQQARSAQAEKRPIEEPPPVPPAILAARLAATNRALHGLTPPRSGGGVTQGRPKARVPRLPPGSRAAGPFPEDRPPFSDRRLETEVPDPATRSGPMPIRTIGIIGAGTMGSGIAQVTA